MTLIRGTQITMQTNHADQSCTPIVQMLAATGVGTPAVGTSLRACRAAPVCYSMSNLRFVKQLQHSING